MTDKEWTKGDFTCDNCGEPFATTERGEAHQETCSDERVDVSKSNKDDKNEKNTKDRPNRYDGEGTERSPEIEKALDAHEKKVD